MSSGIDIDSHTDSLYYRLKSEVSTNVFPLLVLTTLIFIVCRYLIRSLQSNPGGITYVSRKNAIEMVQYKNPFKFNLNSKCASYSGIECTLSSVDDCHVYPLWRVPIYDFHKLLSENSSLNLETAIHTFADHHKCMDLKDYFSLSKDKEVCKEFKPPEEFDCNNFKTLPKPRLHYPFVLVMLSTDFLLTENPQLALLANIIHIPDDVNNIPAQLYQQFTKSTDGTVAVIKKIFPSSFESSQDQNESAELCLVCMQREISVVIVPCGHACICKPCFQKCENCPICRIPIYYYFVSPNVSRQ